MRHLLAANRLVTLLGPGGIGKTRLAVEVAAGIVDQFADGVVFVALASVRDPDLVIGAVAQALGIQEMGSRALIDRLHSRLRTADLLLLLDNFEHVLPAADGGWVVAGELPAAASAGHQSRAAAPVWGTRSRGTATRAARIARSLPPPEQLAQLRGCAVVHRARLERAPAAGTDR